MKYVERGYLTYTQMVFSRQTESLMSSVITATALRVRHLWYGYARISVYHFALSYHEAPRIIGALKVPTGLW